MLINDITITGSEVQQLSNNAAHLGEMSEEPAFRAMETRVHDVYEVYTELEQESKDKMDLLHHWVQQLDDYEHKADDLNAWIDGRMSTLESIGGMSAKFDVEMELQKLKVRNTKKSEVMRINCMLHTSVHWWVTDNYLGSGWQLPRFGLATTPVRVGMKLYNKSTEIFYLSIILCTL